MDSVVGRGTVLAGRYQLAEPRPCGLPETTEWNATDQILVRPVVVRVFPATGAGPALDAARRAALVSDPRLVRVLDVGSDEGAGYVVTEQVNGPTLAQLVAREPLSADQARAVVGEAASALEAARRRGVHHLALRPSAIAVSDDGRVLVSGLALDATLLTRSRGDARTTSRTDATDLVRLVYAALTGHWPGPGDAADGLPTAPERDGVPVPPAELAADVPADLNTLCSVTLGRDDDGPLSPADLVRELEPWGEIRVQGPRKPAVPAPAPSPTTGSGQVVRQSARTAFSGPTPAIDRSVTPPPAAPVAAAAVSSWVPTGPGPLPTDDAPTPAMGLPSVEPDDEPPVTPTAPTRTSAFPSAPSATSAPAPAAAPPAAAAPISSAPASTAAFPPAPPPTRRAAAAPAGPTATSAGLPPAVPPPGPLGAGPGAGPSPFPAGQRSAAQPPAAQFPPAQRPAPDLDPFDFGRVDDEPPRRRTGTAIAIVVVALLVVAGIAFAAKALFGGSSGTPGASGTTTSQSPTSGTSQSPSAAPSSTSPTASPTATARPGASATIASIQSIDPSDADGEHQEAVDRAFDGDPSTFWYTMTYKRDDFAGFKPAVGLAITLTEPATVSTVTLHVNGTGGNVEVRTGDATTPSGGTVLASGPMSADTVLKLDPAQTGSSLVLWFTQLPTTADGSFRVELTEIQLG